ncbi:MAG: hypothetical protein ACU837_00570 [Gammaproteobacteria bacterium]
MHHNIGLGARVADRETDDLAGGNLDIGNQGLRAVPLVFEFDGTGFARNTVDSTKSYHAHG